MSINKKCWYIEVCTRMEDDNCPDSCRKYLEMNYLMENSGLPKAKRQPIRLVPTNDHDKQSFKELNSIRKDIYNFVLDGCNLYIASEYTGNGKTSWAIKLLHKYFEEVWDGNCLKVRGMFVHVPTLLSDLKDFDGHTITPEYKKLLRECDLVVWDDIASDMMSGYDLSQLNIFIDNRTLAEKSNIYTGNIVDENEMLKVLGPRLTSRIYKASTVITLEGEDERDG